MKVPYILAGFALAIVAFVGVYAYQENQETPADKIEQGFNEVGEGLEQASGGY